jgi:hypothetical protein
MPRPSRTALGIAAIVAEEQDQRIIQHAGLPQVFDHPANALVDAIDYGSVDSHDVIEAVLLLGTQAVPGGHVVRPGLSGQRGSIMPISICRG